MLRLGRDCFCRREAPRLGALVCPLCWRCSGLFSGAAAGLAVLLCLPPPPLGILAGLGVLCGLPAGADVLAQLVSPYRSFWSRRLWTGCLLGLAVALLSRALALSFLPLGSPLSSP